MAGGPASLARPSPPYDNGWTAGSYPAGVVISYVVRLRPDALADGRFVGEIEAVTSRQRRSIRTIDQMASFMLATTGSQVRAAAAAHRQVSEENEDPEAEDADR